MPPSDVAPPLPSTHTPGRSGSGATAVCEAGRGSQGACGCLGGGREGLQPGEGVLGQSRAISGDLGSSHREDVQPVGGEGEQLLPAGEEAPYGRLARVPDVLPPPHDLAARQREDGKAILIASAADEGLPSTPIEVRREAVGLGGGTWLGGGVVRTGNGRRGGNGEGGGRRWRGRRRDGRWLRVEE